MAAVIVHWSLWDMRKRLKGKKRSQNIIISIISLASGREKHRDMKMKKNTLGKVQRREKKCSGLSERALLAFVALRKSENPARMALVPHWAPIARRQTLVSEALRWSPGTACTADKKAASISKGPPLPVLIHTRGLAGFPKEKATHLSLCLPSSGLLIGGGPRRVGLGGDGGGWRCYEWACR